MWQLNCDTGGHYHATSVSPPGVPRVTCGRGGKYFITVRPGMLSGHLKSDFISGNISHRLPPVWKYFTKIIPCHQKYVNSLWTGAVCWMLSEINSAAIKCHSPAVNSPFHMHHWLLVQDLDWVVVILCNNFPPQPQIWPQWTHYPLIHNFHPLLPSALAAHGPANIGPDANLGCLGFMNIWKLRLGWSLIGTKSLSFNLLSLYSCLLRLRVIKEIMCIWKIGHHIEIGGAGAGPCQQIGICDGSLVITG